VSSVNGCTLCTGTSWSPCSARSWLISAAIHVTLPFLLGSLLVEGSRYAMAPASAGGAAGAVSSFQRDPSPISVELVAAAPREEERVALPEPQEVLPLEPPKVDEMVKPQVVKKVPAKPKPIKRDQPKPVVPRELAQPVAQAAAEPVSSAPAATLSGAPGSHASLEPQGVGSGESATTAASPDYLRNPPPPYPRESRYNKEEGTVLLAVELNGEGEVSQISLRKSSNFPKLDEAALSAVRRWKFKPARVAGIGVSSSIVVPVKFVLNER